MRLYHEKFENDTLPSTFSKARRLRAGLSRAPLTPSPKVGIYLLND